MCVALALARAKHEGYRLDMATVSNGNAVTPARAGFGRSRDIVPGERGLVVSAAKRIAATTSDKAGLTLDALLVRQYALGVGLWGRAWGRGDYSFEVRDTRDTNARSAVRGALHVCSHTAEKGKAQRCEGGHTRGDSCDYVFVSVGDGVRRWRADGAYEVPSVLADNNATIAAARANVARMVGTLAPAFDTADILATPSIAQCITLGLIDADAIATMGKRKASKARASK